MSSTEAKNDRMVLTKDYLLQNYEKYDMDKSLVKFQFTEDELKVFIEHISMKNMLVSQHLSVDFIVEYILNPKYQCGDSDISLSIDTVLFHQKHIDEKQLVSRLSGGL